MIYTKDISSRFLERLTEMFGVSLVGQIKQTFTKKPITFRVNSIKAKKQEIKNILLEKGFKVGDISWYKDAFVLQNKWKQDIMDLDIYKEGKIYMQSLASMVPPLVLNPKPGEKVLDLTAAPGSKTSQIAGLMNKKGELVANDNNKIRFFKLKHNMDLLGVSGGDFLKLRMEDGMTLVKEYSNYFDKILLDTSCSAEARFIDGKAKTYSFWQEDKIKKIAFIQRKLLFSAWSALKPGGTLVYSTCTFAPEENELQISKFLEENYDCELLEVELSDLKKLPIVKSWKGCEIDKQVIKKAIRIMPTKQIEGFFVVKMMKKS